MRPLLIAVFSCLVGGASVLVAGPARAEDYDVDCAVILCLAAGFPAEPSGTCAAAFAHMIDRVTDLPPKPPIGVCRASDGSEYAPAELSFFQPSRQSRLGWICPEPSPMRFSELVDYSGIAPECYPDALHVPSVLKGGSGHWFLGSPVAAERVHYRFRITLPASEGALPYVSPLFLSDPGRGFARALTSAEQAEYGEWPDLPVEVAP